jgi:AcrR family transcriptional regulator
MTKPASGLRSGDGSTALANGEESTGTTQGSGRRTTKGARTRARLLAAARTVFERDGYFNARVVDIATEAGVGHGTFYTYFDSKDDVFVAVAQLVTDSLFDVYQLPRGLNAMQRIQETNRRYVEVYEQNAAILGLLDQVAPTSDRLREMRMGIRRHFAERLESAIARMNERGRTKPPHLDPFAAGIALGSMVDQICYQWFVMGEPFERDTMLETFDRIWIRALGLPEDDDSAAVTESGDSEAG